MIDCPSRRRNTSFLVLLLCALVAVYSRAGYDVSEFQVLPDPGQGDRLEVLLQQAFEHHSQGRYSQSIPLLQQAYALHPENFAVNLLLGIGYLRTGDLTKALTFLSKANQIQPKDSTTLGYLAETYARLKRFDQAAEAMQLMASVPGDSSQDSVLILVKFYLDRFRVISEELLSSTQGLVYFYRLQAVGLHGTRNPEEREALLRVNRLAPDFPGLHSALGHECLLRSRLQEAGIEFSKAVSANPNDLEAMVGDAVLAVSSGDLQKAERRLAEVGGRSPHRLAAAFREWPAALTLPEDLRRRLLQQHSTAAGMEAASSPRQQFEEQRWESLVASISPRTKSVQESLWRGIGLGQLERYEEAIAPLEAARQEPRLKLEANYWLAHCYARGVEKRVQNIPEENANRWLVHVVHGEFLLRLARDGSAAASEYRKAIDVVPRDPALWDSLAAAQLLAGDTEGARRSAGQALSLDPRRTSASRVLGEAYIKERKYDLAIAPLRQVLESQSEDVTAQVLLGTAYAKTGQDNEAKRLLEAVLRHGYPDEKGAVHYLLGTVLRRLGNQQEAEQAFERSRALSDASAQTSHAPSQTSQPPQ